MVDQKTGGLFLMLIKLMCAASPRSGLDRSEALTKFAGLLGRFFQVRDDYMNLASADYASKLEGLLWTVRILMSKSSRI